jgi:uncharacterized protein
MPLNMSVVYMHGFASSPQSHKARHFRTYFSARGAAFIAPDLNAPDFHDLTIGRMISAAHDAASLLPQDRPLIAVGSSLGGLAATLFATERAVMRRPLAALVLIAPAFELASLWHRRLGKTRLEAWRKQGTLKLEDEQGHLIYGPDFQKLGFSFYADAMRRETQVAHGTASTKTLVFHGNEDREVPVAVSERYAAAQPSVTLVTYPHAGHSLQQELDDMSAQLDRFLP